MNTFTIYRATKSFLDTVNGNEANLNIHRDRSTTNKEVAAQANITLLQRGHLVAVATVTCAPQDLFELTNSINHFWGINEEVTLLPAVIEDGFMSSSCMGDVYKDEEGIFHFYTMSSTHSFSMGKDWEG
jgi:hypothetical protein